MRYRASAPPKGRWGRFLQAQRHQRGWSQTRAFEELREGLRLGPKSRASYVNLDLGNREPSPEEAAFLTTFYGEEPEPAATTTGPTELSELAASIRDLARAIQEERAERLEWERGVLESVSSLARWLGQRDDPAPAPLASGREVGR